MSTRKIVAGDDLDTLIHDLGKLSDDSTLVCKRSLYEGAGEVYKAYRQNVEAIPVDERTYIYSSKDRKHGITSQQKADLVKAAGIAKMRSEINAVNTKIGVHGYNSVKTKKYPGGQPNILIARSVQAGTSYMQRYDFAGRARRQAKGPAVEKMKTALKREIAKRTK